MENLDEGNYIRYISLKNFYDIKLALGGFIWLVVSIIWREPALIVTNGVLFVVGVSGLIYTNLL